MTGGMLSAVIASAAKQSTLALPLDGLLRFARNDGSARRVGKAQRAHHLDHVPKMVGTAQVRLCPPYGVIVTYRAWNP